MEKEFRNKILLGDCRELIKGMEDRSVDVSFTSPPYFDNGEGKSGTNQKNKTHSKYLNKEVYDDYTQFLIDITNEMIRVSKKYVLVNLQPLKNSAKNFYEYIGHYSDRIDRLLVWAKNSAQPCGNKHKISNYCEYIIVFSNKKDRAIDVNSDFYKNVITVNEKNDNPYSDIHGAVMNLAFCKEIVKEFTSEGDLVLDVFAGTGTTLAVAKSMGRDYCGFELEPTYYDICCKRVEETKHSVVTRDVREEKPYTLLDYFDELEAKEKEEKESKKE